MRPICLNALLLLTPAAHAGEGFAMHAELGLLGWLGDGVDHAPVVPAIHAGADFGLGLGVALDPDWALTGELAVAGVRSEAEGGPRFGALGLGVGATWHLDPAWRLTAAALAARAHRGSEYRWGPGGRLVVGWSWDARGWRPGLALTGTHSRGAAPISALSLAVSLGYR